MRPLFLIVLFIYLSFSLNGQKREEIDSLNTLLLTAKEDSTKTALYLSLAKSYYRSAPDSTYKYASQALSISKQNNDRYATGRAYRMIGLSYAGKSEYDTALVYYFMALNEFKDLNKRSDVGVVLTSIGIVYRKKNDYEKALDYYLRSLEIIKEEKDSVRISAGLTNVGIIYEKLKEYDKALEYHMESLEIGRRASNKKGIPYTMGNIASVYMEIGNYDEALIYLKEALSMFESFNYLNEAATSHTKIGEIYLKREKYTDAFNSVQKANKLYSETGNKAGLAETFIILGNLYMRQGAYDSADKALSLGIRITEEIGYMDNLLLAYQYFAMLDSARNNFESAFNYYRKYSYLNDSIFTQEKNRALAEIQTKYDVAEKERENLRLRKDKEIDAIRIKRQRIINISVIAAFLLISFAVFFIYNAYRKLKKLNLLLKSKNDEIYSQNASLIEHKEEIKAQYEEISAQNEKLQIYKHELEGLVKERTRQLNKALLDAKSSDRLKSQFLENLSHEIRTPMNAISGFSMILSKDKFNFEPEYLYNIHKSMDDLVNTMERLVTFTKLQIEQYQLKTREIDLNNYFKRLKKSVKERRKFLKKDGIKLKFQTDFQEPEAIFVSDDFILDIILKEIIENAFKFTEKGQITVKTSLDEKRQLQIIINDTGVGIRPEMINQVYEFLKKFDKKDVIYRGMGVGLALVQKATLILSGELKINSDYEDGAELIVTIPELN
jgi:signal transduction histidine kinase